MIFWQTNVVKLIISESNSLLYSQAEILPEIFGVVMDREQKVVSLEKYDGYKFEKLCATILERTGYGRVTLTPKSGDGGKDIIVTARNGEVMYVECKHHPNKTIGRPVVQKLHSAMMTGKADCGMVITSGRFSPDAENYVRQNRIPIKLIDINILSSISKKVGIQIYQNNAPIKISGYPIPPRGKVETCIEKYLSQKYVSSPLSVKEIVNFKNGHVRKQPVYECYYDVDFTIKSPTYVLKHDSSSKNRLLIDGRTGKLYPEFQTSIISKSQKVDYSKLNSNTWKEYVDDFQISETTLRKNLLAIIKEKHTDTVSYVGNNNVKYSKTGSPSNRDIDIYNVEQVFVPNLAIDICVDKSKYQLRNCYCNNNALYIPEVLDECAICGKKIDFGVICNDCGNLVHNPRSLDSHSFVCEKCGKTICRNCTYVAKGKRVCLDCAKSSGFPYTHISKNMNQVTILLAIIATITALFAVLSFAMNYVTIGSVIVAIGCVILGCVFFLFRYKEKVSGNYVELSFK